MKNCTKYLMVAALSFVLSTGRAQQTIQFSQYVFNGLAVNPAYAGYKEDWTASLSYRMQWTGIEDAPRTGTFSFDGITGSNKKNSGIGLVAANDRLGPQSTTSVYINYSYRIRLDLNDTKRLSFGMGIGAAQYSLDVSKFSATNVSDSAIPVSNESTINPDLRAGIYYYSPAFYFGLSGLNLLAAAGYSDTYTLLKTTPHIYLTAGALIPLSGSLDLKPSFLLKDDLKGPTNIDLTTYIALNRKIWLGGSYRTGASSLKSNLEHGLRNADAVAAIAQFYYNDHFRIGYSYDFTTSSLASYQSGSHELSISFGVQKKKDRILSPRYF